MLKPLGDLSPEEAEEGFLRQAEILIQEGVDLISIETMFSLEETLLALRAAKAAGSVPVSASVTFTRTKKGYFTLMGEGVSQCVAAMEGAEADVVASNCTLGSSDMIDLTAQMAGAATRPLLIQPNAGNPVTRKGVTTYEQSPEDFARDSHDIWKAGASMLGGCCGTDPRFIRTLVGALDP
jgi:5-methyltetrahydrofolate--homocysteine methyltransferase